MPTLNSSVTTVPANASASGGGSPASTLPTETATPATAHAIRKAMLKALDSRRPVNCTVNAAAK